MRDFSSLPPVCVTGMGCVCAAGDSVSGVLQALDGVCAGTAVPVHASAVAPRRTNATLLHKDALPHPFFAAPESIFCEHGREHGHGSRSFSAKDTLRLALHAVDEALAQAQLPRTHESAVVMGTTAGSALHFLDGYAAHRHAPPQQSQLQPPLQLASDITDYFDANLALNIADAFHLTGPALTIANACTSGADAIGVALDMILQGQCNTVICGGADALSLVPHTGFARLMIYSKEPCRPFDAHRQGLNLGEGAGVLILESTAHAHARGATILGYVAGYGAAADAHHFTAPHPEARGLDAAVHTALTQAHITKDALAFINAHGTATPENDKVEGAYFQKHFADTPVWGSKSLTGHTLGAAGAVEAIFCLLALQQGCVPATLGFQNSDPEIGLTPTTSPLILSPSTHNDYALSTSLGFGGSNAALVLKGATTGAMTGASI